MKRAIHWWLSAPLTAAQAITVVISVWLAIAALVSMPVIATH